MENLSSSDINGRHCGRCPNDRMILINAISFDKTKIKESWNSSGTQTVFDKRPNDPIEKQRSESVGKQSIRVSILK